MDRGSVRGIGRRTRGVRRAPALVALVAVISGVWLEGAAAGGASLAAGGPTRADLDLLRRRVALLESELALARSRKPYLIVDAEAKRLRYRLLGSTMREIALSMVRFDGLRSSDEGGVRGPLTDRKSVV